jgi:soluble lytic murein transglycosylase-like protein
MPVSIPSQYVSQVDAAAKALGIPVDVVGTQLDTESSWNPNAVSPTGAEGLAQFEPGTWTEYGHGSPFDPTSAFAAYTAYMGALLSQYRGDLRKALAAYNAGGGNLSAGYGYADGILQRAGAVGATSTNSGSTSAGSTASQIGSGVLGGLLQLPDQVTGLFTALEKPVQALAWFINPTNWARMLSGGIGVLLLIAGLVTLGLAV